MISELAKEADVARTEMVWILIVGKKKIRGLPGNESRGCYVSVFSREV